MVETQLPIVVLHSGDTWLPELRTWLYNLVKYSPPEITSHIVCDRTENMDRYTVPNIHCLLEPEWPLVVNRALRRLKLCKGSDRLFVAKSCRAQIIHSHFGHQACDDMVVARSGGIKHVATFYGYDISYLPKSDPIWPKLYHQLFDGVDRILCEGAHMAQCVVALGCPEDKIRVHHLGVRTDEIAFRPRKWNGKEPLRILLAATFREKKGFPYGLDALGRISGEVPLEITVMGGDVGDERTLSERAKIEGMIEKHNMQNIVNLVNFQPASVFFEEAYRHHIFLSPSVTAEDGDTEGGVPVGIIETLASGMPVISTWHCDIPEVIQHGVSGLLAQERDVDGLVEHLMWMVHNPDKWEDMVTAGRQWIDQHYDVRVQGVRLAEVYRELVYA